VSHALSIISWQENLTEEHMPPEWMWSLDDELELWFDEVKASFHSRSSSMDDGDEEAPMMSNALARGRR
jgi:hypothetical protein